MEAIDRLGETAQGEKRGDEVLEPGEIFAVGCGDDVAEYDDEGDEWGEEDGPIEC